MPTTLQNIAVACGKDVSTVSRALRSDPRVRRETRDLILAVAEEMDYEPNPAARTLASGRTQTIWFLVPTLDSVICRIPSQAASLYMWERGYDVPVVMHHHDPERYLALLRRLEQRVTDGAVVVPCRLNVGEKELERLARSQFPLVFLDRHPSFARQPTVTSENVDGAARLAEAMLEAGVDRFLVLFDIHRNTVERERLQGVVNVLGRTGVPFVIADAGGDDALPDPEGVLGVIGSSQIVVSAYVRMRPEAFSKRRSVFGVFDGWRGDPLPAERVFMCPQDLQTMAKTSCDIILANLQGNAPAATTTAVPTLEISVVESQR